MKVEASQHFPFHTFTGICRSVHVSGTTADISRPLRLPNQTCHRGHGQRLIEGRSSTSGTGGSHKRDKEPTVLSGQDLIRGQRLDTTLAGLRHCGTEKLVA